MLLPYGSRLITTLRLSILRPPVFAPTSLKSTRRFHTPFLPLACRPVLPPIMARKQPGAAAPKRGAKRTSTTAAAAAAKGDDADDLTPPPVQSEVESVVDTAVKSVLARRRRAVKKPTYVEEAEGDDGEDEPMVEAGETKPKATRGRKRAAVSPEADLSAPESDGSDLTAEPASAPKPTPKKKTPRKKVKVDPDAEAEDGDADGAATPAKKARTPKKPTPKKSRMAAKDEPEFDEDGNEIVKKKRKVKVVPKLIYDIPAVERLETTFKGKSWFGQRLGKGADE